MEPPVRCLPHLHHTLALRRRHLLAVAAGTPSRWRGTHLLRPARHRHRPGHVRNAMITRALPASHGRRMRSAGAARPRPDGVAVSPAIGPLPAIYVPAHIGGTMPETPVDLRYSKDHLWVRPGPGTGLVRVGVTDFAQQSLGDVG